MLPSVWVTCGTVCAMEKRKWRIGEAKGALGKVFCCGEKDLAWGLH